MSDHREVARIFEQARTIGDKGSFHALAMQAIAELARLSVAEEQYLYPAMCEHLDGGDELADHEIAEHAEAERIMKEIEGQEAGRPGAREKSDKLVEEVSHSHHIRNEEPMRSRGLRPPARTMTWSNSVQRLSGQRRSRRRGHIRPHRICLP